MLRLLTGLALALVFQGSASFAQDCNALSAEACVTSAQCILDKEASTDKLVCEPAANRCEIGYRQHFTAQYFRNDNAKSRCEARPACVFQSPAQCYCPPISGLRCICSGGNAHQCVPDDTARVAPPEGAFVITATRRAADIASPAPDPTDASPIGQTLELGPNSLSLPGMGCEAWDVHPTSLAVNPSDPNLSDLFVPQIGAPFSDGDGLILQSWNYTCEGQDVFVLTQVDPRVVVLSFFSTGLYTIASRPLTTDQTKRLQAFLKDVKFYSGPIDGQLSEATNTALGYWLEERLRPVQTYRFKNVTITQNLLDRTGVLTND